MYKVRSFKSGSQYDLDKKINEFLESRKHIKVINTGYSTTMVGYTVQHYALLCYEES